LNNNNKKKQRWVKNLDIANFLFHVKVKIHRTFTVRNLRHWYNKKNILPLVEGVMVDDHTLKNISHSGIRISPSTSSRVIFFFQSVIFFPTTIISTSNIFIMVGYNCFIIFQYHYLNIKILKFYEN
jgi:hypothetical protein